MKIQQSNNIKKFYVYILAKTSVGIKISKKTFLLRGPNQKFKPQLNDFYLIKGKGAFSRTKKTS